MEDDILHLDAPAIPEEKASAKGRWAAPVIGPAPEENDGVISLEQPQPVSTAEDVARSTAGQGVLGATDIGGIPGTLGQLWDLGAQKANKYLVLKPLEAMGALPPGETAETAEKSAAELGKKFQSPAEQAGAVNTIAGVPFATGKGVEELTQEAMPFTKYEPKTTAGKFAGNAARTAVGMGEMGALASAAKGAGVGEAARNIARETGVGAVAGAGSELAGQGAEAYLPEWASPYARFLGAVGGTITGSKIADAVKYAAMPTPTASEALARALGKDIQGGHTPMTIDQINTAIAQGGMPTIFDMAGPETRKVLKYYGALTPEAEAAAAKMAKEMGERTAVSGQALGEHIEKNLGTSLDTAAKQAAIDAAAKTQNDALYKIARSSPNAKSVMNPELEGLMKIDAVKQAMKKANSAATDPQSGIVAYTPGTPTKQVSTGLFDQSGNPIMKTVQGSSATNPNLTYWDQVKRSLDDQIGAAITSNKRDTVRRLTGIKNRLTDTLDKAVPEYATARNAAADAFGASNSIEAGYNALKGMNAFKIQDTLNALKGMPANEQKLFAQGAAGYLKEIAENGGPAAVVRMMEKPSISNRIRAAIGDQAADSIYGRAHAESLMAKTSALPPPLPTQGGAPVSMLTKTLIGGAGAPAIEAAYNAAMHGAISPSALITAAVGATGAATLSAGMSFAEKRIAPRIMEMAASKDPATIQELGRMAQGNNAVRSVLEKLNGAAETSLNSYYRSNPANVSREQDRATRPTRATGGAVNLMALSKAAKKHVTRSTEDLLNESDDTVARALEVANKHI
jgi:hypothetical protein